MEDAARSELNRWLLARTLRIAAAWLGDARQCVVVSPCASTLALARHAGVHTVEEPLPAPGLNGALVQGAGHAVMLGARQLMILPCDLPALTPAALNSMYEAAQTQTDIVIAPDRHGSGTNAMLSPATGCEFAFGVGSLARHIAMADARGMRVRLCREPALAFDLDTPADFHQWLRSGAERPPFLAARQAA